MPFDGLIAKPKFSFLNWFRTARTEPEFVGPLTVLDKLRLIPVPAEVLANHKEKVAAGFHRMHKIHHSSRSIYRWCEYYQADTQMMTNPQGDCWPTPHAAKNDVLAAVRGMGYQGIGTRKIPRPVYAIADAVTRRADKLGIETERVAGYFYLDPYVSLLYREDGEVKRACLAIWDGDRVFNIAKLT